MKELGFPITIPYARDPLETHKGFLPMRLKREKTGVEFDVFDGRDDIEEIANGCEVDPAFDRSANFRWGGDATRCCARCAPRRRWRGSSDGVVLGEDDENRSLRTRRCLGATVSQGAR